MSKLDKIKKILEWRINTDYFWSKIRVKKNRDINELIKYTSKFFVDFSKLKNLSEKEIVEYYKNDKEFNYFIWNKWEDNEKMKNIIIGLFVYLIKYKYPNYSGNLKISYVDESMVHSYPIIYICDIKNTYLFYTGYLKSDEKVILLNRNKYFYNGKSVPEFFETDLNIKNGPPRYDIYANIMANTNVFDFYFGNPNTVLKEKIIDVINDKVMCYDVRIKK